MCGIVGYVGRRPACEIVVDALRRMEYRGYDSSGVALLDGALATVECRTTQAHPAGDHTIVVGAVVSARVDERPDDALIYYRSRYGSTR